MIQLRASARVPRDAHVVCGGARNRGHDDPVQGIGDDALVSVDHAMQASARALVLPEQQGGVVSPRQPVRDLRMHRQHAPRSHCRGGVARNSGDGGVHGGWMHGAKQP